MFQTKSRNLEEIFFTIASLQKLMELIEMWLEILCPVLLLYCPLSNSKWCLVWIFTLKSLIYRLIINLTLNGWVKKVLPQVAESERSCFKWLCYMDLVFNGWDRKSFASNSWVIKASFKIHNMIICKNIKLFILSISGVKRRIFHLNFWRGPWDDLQVWSLGQSQDYRRVAVFKPDNFCLKHFFRECHFDELFKSQSSKISLTSKWLLRMTLTHDKTTYQKNKRKIFRSFDFWGKK